jgi:hypothetical protein
MIKIYPESETLFGLTPPTQEKEKNEQASSSPCLTLSFESVVESPTGHILQVCSLSFSLLGQCKLATQTLTRNDDAS